MKTLNINEINTNLSANAQTIVTTKETQNALMIDALNTMKKEILTAQDDLGINYKLAMKTVAKRYITKDLMQTVTSKNGKTTLKYNGTKELKRVITIATTMLFRKMDINIELLTISQIENLVNYGSVNGVNELLDSETYSEDVVKYLKELKTREVISKTFEKKAKLA